MAGNKFQIKRTSVSGRTPEVSNTSASGYIDTGELALNFTDKKLFSSDGSNYFEIGSNLTNIQVTGPAIVDSLQFNTTANVEANAQGQVVWNADEETLDLRTDNGSVLQLGQEVVYHVRNNTSNTILDGTPVMATGTIGNSSRITIAPMDGTSIDNAKYYLGIATEEIAADTDGKVTHFGKVRGIDLQAYNEGDVLWISNTTVGELTSTMPTTGIKSPVVFVIANTSNGTLFSRATSGTKLRESHDVIITSPANNEILSYVNGVWINQTAEELGLSDTLDSVTSRGAVTNNVITVGGLVVNSNVTIGGSLTLSGLQSTATNGDVLTYNSSTDTMELATPSAGGGGTTWTVKTANYTAATGDGIVADTSGGTFTVTLPATPSAGDNVIIADGGDWKVTNLTVARNGSTIEGAAENLTLDIGSIQVHLIYSGTTWEVYAFTGPGVSVQADDNTTNATKYITWADATSGGYDPKVSSTKLTFNPSTGTLSATDFNSTSDISLKENIETISNASDKVSALRGVNFNWKETGDYTMGVVAQEVEEIIPEVVVEREDGIKTVNYQAMVGLLIESVKDLQKQVDELKEKN